MIEPEADERHSDERRRPSVADRLRVTYGIARSLAIYYGIPWRTRRMSRLYGRFLGPGDLAFDVGAHVGNRTRCWRSLGARVVAVEPQPALIGLLRRLYGRDNLVHLVGCAVARAPGALTLRLNPANPMIATASAAFLEAARVAPSFQGQVWRGHVSVFATTLDRLVQQYGTPRFIKLDVEGFEAEALAGLSHPVFALSIEYLPMARGIIEACLERLRDLADYRFNASVAETMRLVFPAAVGADEIRAWLRSLGHDDPAGDLYACRDPGLLRG